MKLIRPLAIAGRLGDQGECMLLPDLELLKQPRAQHQLLAAGGSAQALPQAALVTTGTLKRHIHSSLVVHSRLDP
jgi:hypothetical protein